MKRIILYPPGFYGRFLEWSIRTLTKEEKIIYPFAEDGTAHNSYKSLLSISSDKYPKLENVLSENIIDKDNLNLISTHFYSKKDYLHINFNKKNLYIIIKPDFENKALIMNNLYFKLDKWIDSLIKKRNIKINKKQRSEIRNLIYSISKEDFSDYFELTMPIVSTKNCHILYITIGELVYNYQSTILKVFGHFKLEVGKNFLQIKNIYDSWIASQKYFFKDDLVNFIVEQIINEQNYNFKNIPLTVVDEAEIILRLERKNILINCHELPNNFPRSTLELKKYIKREI